MIGDELRERSRRFALDVIRLCLKLGRDDLGNLVRPQLLRAGTGVATNHQAAGRSRSRKEFISRLAVAIEEAEESEFWLSVLLELKYGPLEMATPLRQESEELLRILSKSRSTARSRGRKKRSRAEQPIADGS